MNFKLGMKRKKKLKHANTFDVTRRLRLHIILTGLRCFLGFFYCLRHLLPYKTGRSMGYSAAKLVPVLSLFFEGVGGVWCKKGAIF